MKNIKYFLLTLFCLSILSKGLAQDSTVVVPELMKIAIAGLRHDHVTWILDRAKDGDFELVGIAEANQEIAEKYSKSHGFSMDIVYKDIDEMLANTSPEAVCAYNPIRKHLDVVEKCAPKGIHVMVEKPLAVNLEDARKMKALAEEHNIHLLTNYETTWYASNQVLKNYLTKQWFIMGDIRKIIIHDGHWGPKEIGVSKEFLEWLTDPYFNGGGALMDFGCYGANLSTWMHNGEKPISVTAVTQQIKPETYPNVDDEATIILQYPKSQSVLQASWNWSISRKDMEVYTQVGYLKAKSKNELQVMETRKERVEMYNLNELKAPFNDSFLYLIAVVNGDITMDPEDLTGLANNMTVMEILEAAKISAKEGRTVLLSEL